MEEDIRKQGMLYLQQQRFGKVGALAAASCSANASIALDASLRSFSISVSLTVED